MAFTGKPLILQRNEVTLNQRVLGSSPSAPTNKFKDLAGMKRVSCDTKSVSHVARCRTFVLRPFPGCASVPLPESRACRTSDFSGTWQQRIRSIPGPTTKAAFTCNDTGAVPNIGSERRRSIQSDAKCGQPADAPTMMRSPGSMPYFLAVPAFNSSTDRTGPLDEIRSSEPGLAFCSIR